MTSARHAQSGFSLIEMMVALVAGLVVTGAVLAFTISSLRSNTDYVKSTRLTQELRNTSDFLASELKRAGYDQSAMSYVANPSLTKASLFAPILVDNANAASNCVLYAYDRVGGRDGKVDGDNGELRGIRRTTATINSVVIGVIEVAESTATVTPACGGASPDYSQYPVVCNAASGWCPLSDPRTLNVSVFTMASTASTNSHGIQTLTAVTGGNALALREYEMTLTGNLVADASVSRTIRSNVKVRADCLRTNVTATSPCFAAPTITP
jgi:prepilin-type N-terminal cleavage/methylation domain-containing protein